MPLSTPTMSGTSHCYIANLHPFTARAAAEESWRNRRNHRHGKPRAGTMLGALRQTLLLAIVATVRASSTIREPPRLLLAAQRRCRPPLAQERLPALDLVAEWGVPPPHQRNVTLVSQLSLDRYASTVLAAQVSQQGAQPSHPRLLCCRSSCSRQAGQAGEPVQGVAAATGGCSVRPLAVRLAAGPAAWRAARAAVGGG